MAVKDLISPGIGFTPASIKFILTRGLGIGAAVANVGPAWVLFAQAGPTIKAVGQSDSRLRVQGQSGSAINVIGEGR